jgi:hypothetical protein
MGGAVNNLHRGADFLALSIGMVVTTALDYEYAVFAFHTHLTRIS